MIRARMGKIAKIGLKFEKIRRKKVDLDKIDQESGSETESDEKRYQTGWTLAKNYSKVNIMNQGLPRSSRKLSQITHQGATNLMNHDRSVGYLSQNFGLKSDASVRFIDINHTSPIQVNDFLGSDNGMGRSLMQPRDSRMLPDLNIGGYLDGTIYSRKFLRRTF